VVAFFFTDRFGVALVIAWGSGTLAIVGGIGASFIWDLATGPLLVCAFGAVLVLAALLKSVLGVRPASRVRVKALSEPGTSREASASRAP
jgi:ABC-type Mn2+/Zn2+ transport system permease subunit